MIGSNVSTVGGIDKGFVQAKKWGCESIQVYTTPSRRWNFNPREISSIKKYFEEFHKGDVKKVVSYVPFLVNLGTSDVDLYKKSINRLREELISAAELNIGILVLHPGSCSNGSIEEALLRISEGINTAFSQTRELRTVVLLETMAGQGNVLGSTFEDLAFIFEHVHDKSRVGICWTPAIYSHQAMT